jgi:hypothetical protein
MKKYTEELAALSNTIKFLPNDYRRLGLKESSAIEMVELLTNVYTRAERSYALDWWNGLTDAQQLDWDVWYQPFELNFYSDNMDRVVAAFRRAMAQENTL